jgi:hypothetical protein
MRKTIFLGLASLGSLLAGASLAACGTGARGDEAEGADQALASNVHVLTSRNDPGRTSANLEEKVLTTSNVKAGSFGKVYARSVDGQIYAQPLYVGGVNGKNVVYVATEHNSVYAFDADDVRASAPPIWQKNLGPSVPSQDTGCGLLSPEIGITSTPVIDLQAKTIWVTAKTKESGRYVHRLHALDIATGAERPSSPVEIIAQAPGDGAGSVGGVVRLDPLKHLQRPGILKAGNTIYLGFGSNCDIDPYHGWVIAYDATTLQQKGVHVDTPGGEMGGIWHAGVGLASDEAGDVFYVSGNGTFDGQTNFGNSTVRLHPTANGLVVASWFTPFDSSAANARDLDLGSTGGMLIPGTNKLLAGDKRGVFFLVDKDQMGGFANGDAQIVQRFQATARGAFGGAAFYKKGAGGTLYVWGTGDRLKAFRFDGQRFLTPPLVNASTLIGYPGGQVSVSANGEIGGTAIVWTVRSKRTSPGLAISAGAGVLQALDASDITRELWSSDARAQDALGDVSKFAPPTIANGRVFVGTSSNQLVAYGLFAGAQPDAGVATPLDAGSDAGDAGAPRDGGEAPTWTQLYTRFFGPDTPGHCSGTGGCHTTLRAGFKCGTSKNECWQGLVNAGLITPASPSQSPLAKPGDSPLVWLGGSMPLDDPSAHPEAAAAVQAWIAAGAKND